MDLDTLYRPRPDAPSLAIDRVLPEVPPQDVWALLFTPIHSARVWFGSTLETELRPGGFVRWTGTWEGCAFEDRAIVLDCDSGAFLDALYFSGFSGLQESPQTRMRLTIRISSEGSGCRVRVTQENFQDIGKRDHSIEGWNGILDIVAQGIPSGE